MALGLLALSEVQLGVYGRCCDPARVTDAGFLLTVAATVPLAWRRRARARGLLVTGCAAVTQLVLHSPVTDLSTLAIAVAFYGVMAESSRRLAVPLAALAPAGIAVALGLGHDVPPYQILNIPMLFAGAWALGELTRRRRGQLAERASLAEREQEHPARQAAASERGRIARELHDVVSHSLSVISVQAGAARTVMDTAPEPAAAGTADVPPGGGHGLAGMGERVRLAGGDLWVGGGGCGTVVRVRLPTAAGQ